MNGIEEKSKPDFFRWFLIAVVVVIGLGIIGGGIFVYQKALKSKTTAAQVQPTVTPKSAEVITSTPEASPTAQIKLAKKDLKIKVLNGTGVPGAAGKAVQILEKNGWTGIKTGNATDFDNQKTTIQIKADKKEFLPLLIEDLSTDYLLADKEESLADKESFDAIIILGPLR